MSAHSGGQPGSLEPPAYSRSDLKTFIHPIRAVYLLGSEVNGLPAEVTGKCEHVLEIESVNYPSYNVSVSGALVMYHRLISGKLR